MKLKSLTRYNDDKLKKHTKLLKKIYTWWLEKKSLERENHSLFFPFAVFFFFFFKELSHFWKKDMPPPFFLINEITGKDKKIYLKFHPKYNSSLLLCSILCGCFNDNACVHINIHINMSVCSCKNIGFCHSFRSFANLIGGKWSFLFVFDY